MSEPSSKVIHDPVGQEFSILLPDTEERCKLLYSMQGGEVELWHTEVPPAWRGRGLAGALATTAMNWVVTQPGTTALLSCSFVEKFVRDQNRETWNAVLCKS